MSPTLYILPRLRRGARSPWVAVPQAECVAPVASPAPVQAQRVRFAERHSKEPLYRGPIRFARASAYIPAMDDLAYWTKKLQAAEQELDAATTRTAINGAAKRVMLAKRELKRLEQKATG